ncbi:MAG: hypothetical protein R2873_21215 [Caldilineaceae bacterium]
MPAAGAVLSAVDANLPTGPMIIVVAFGLVLLSILFAPGRGLLWTSLRSRRDRRRFAATNVLRDLYHYALDHGSAEHAVPMSFVTGVSDDARAGLAQLERRGWVRAQGDAWQLTAAGITAARDDAANRQLWAVYREYSEELHLPLVPENRQVDIHELLPGQAIEKLERKLKEVGV